MAIGKPLGNGNTGVRRARAQTIKDFGRHRSTAWVGFYELLASRIECGVGRAASQTNID
jgi:hypothetical protein